MWVTKRLISPAKIRIFNPKTAKFGPEIGIFVHFGPGLAGSFGALLVGWLVVVAHGLYLARHLLLYVIKNTTWQNTCDGGGVVVVMGGKEFGPESIIIDFARFLLSAMHKGLIKVLTSTKTPRPRWAIWAQTTV